MKPLVSIVVATNRPWFWARLGRQYSTLTTEHVALELVVVPDEFQQETGYFLDLVDVLPLHGGFVMVPVPAGTKVGEKFRLGAKWAHGDFIAFRSDDSIWHPRQFDRLYQAYTHARCEQVYVGYGHGWFWAPNAKPDLLHFALPDHVIMGTALIERTAVLATKWERGGEVQDKASDTHFMDALMATFGTHKPLDRSEVYGLWLNHQHNMWDRTRLNYTVPIHTVSDRVTEDRPMWDRLLNDAARTIIEHHCDTCR